MLKYLYYLLIQAHSPRYNYRYLSAYFIGSVKGSSQPVHTPSLARACAAHTH